MKQFVKELNGLPFLAKLILCIPFLDLVWSVGRVANGIAKKNVLLLVIGILTIFPGVGFMWIIDLILIIVRGKAAFMQ